MSYGIDPSFHIKAILLQDSTSKDSLPLDELDGGIIEGALRSRFEGTTGASIHREMDSEGSLIYTLEMPD